MPPHDDAAAAFEPLRPRLIRVAYGMLGSVAEAEDVVQNAYLRWHRANREEVRDVERYLVRTVTRLCLDVLKSARRQREQYAGPWLPEPLVEPADAVGDDITFALMMALERLSPLERAAFLLHDVFGLPHGEVAASIRRDPAACRQLARRAREHVRAAAPRYPLAEDRAREIVTAFFEASSRGEMEALRALLADDAVLYSDGGGKVRAARNPIRGRDRVARFLGGIARKSGGRMPTLLHEGRINGQPGLIALSADGVVQTVVLSVSEDAVTAIYIVRNPEKLRHVQTFVATREAGDGEQKGA